LSVQVLLNRRAYKFLVNGRKSHKEWGEQRHANIGLHNDKQKETAEWLHDDNLVGTAKVKEQELGPLLLKPPEQILRCAIRVGGTCKLQQSGHSYKTQTLGMSLSNAMVPLRCMP